MDRQRFEIHAAHEADHWWFTARRHIVRTLLRQLVPTGEGHVVVEVGCGTGGNTAAFSKDYEAIGADPAADAIRLARHRFPQATFVEGLAPDCIRDPLREARAVLLLDVLEHVEDDVGLLSELLAATAPGTMFLVTVPADAALWSSHDVVHEHYRRYDADRLARTWEGLPVACRMLSGMNARLYPLVKFVRSTARLLRGSYGSSGTDLSTPPGPLNRVLHRVFAGETGRLLHDLDTGGSTHRRSGVSLVTVLERLPGDVPRKRREPGRRDADNGFLREAA